MNRDALKSAARAAVVMPLVFAFAYTVIGRPQTSIFAAFGCFATLVLVEFGGRPPPPLAAHLGPAPVAVAFLTLRTLFPLPPRACPVRRVGAPWASPLLRAVDRA